MFNLGRGDGKKQVHSREMWAGFREESAYIAGESVLHCQRPINNPGFTVFVFCFHKKNCSPFLRMGESARRGR